MISRVPTNHNVENGFQKVWPWLEKLGRVGRGRSYILELAGSRYGD